MNHDRTASFAGYFSVPLALVLADGLIRSRVVLAFTWVEWSYYLASVVVMTAAYGAIIQLLRRLRRRPSRWPEAGTRLAVALACLLVLGAGYGAYFANGDLPDVFLLSYIRCEPKNALILFQNSVRAGYVVLLLLGVAGVSVWLGWVCRFAWEVPLRGWRRRTLVVGMAWAALWYCWSGTAGRGQCFVPLVRIPAVIAMAGCNEWNGVNPQPIRLPPRQPLEIATSLPRPPVNVLVILNESLRRQNLGIYGHHRNTTPAMARFASEHPEGFFKFDRAYTNSTTTLLSVPSILTGISPLQPIHHRVEAPLLWQWAKAADMETFYITSHDLSWCRIGPFITTPSPDVFWDQATGGLPHYRDLGCDDHFTVDQAVRHLEATKNSTRPFLGVVHLNSNHYPYNTREDYQRWNGSKIDSYDNTIVETDAHTDRLIAALSAAGKLEQTVIIFASDHGEGFNEHGYIAHFYCHFTETISVPLWFYLPPALAQRRDLSALRANLAATVQNLDLMPTILDCIGAWDHAPTAVFRQPMLGRSLLRPLPAERTVWITNTDEILHSVIGLSSVTGTRHYMLRTSSMPAKEDLYDLAADPAERHNLWGQLSEPQRDVYRTSFLRFPVAAGMMRASCPNLPPGP